MTSRPAAAHRAWAAVPRGAVLWGVLLGAAVAGPLAAQQPSRPTAPAPIDSARRPPAPGDTLARRAPVPGDTLARRASMPGDTLRKQGEEPARPGIQPDSLAADTGSTSTKRLLEANRRAATRVPMMPLPLPDGPEPATSRFVFTRDSLDWMLGQTVSDLLLKVPGAYVWRGGWLGRPEPANVAVRGAAASTSWFLDGLPWIPAGADSVGVDGAQFPLSFLDRVEIERWPGWLRISLFTRRHDRLAPRSRLGFGRGQNDVSRLQGAIESRAATGVGWSIGADYLNLPTSPTNQIRFNDSRIFGQVSYVQPHWGLQYQLFRLSPTYGNGDTTSGAFTYKGERAEEQARLYLRSRADGFGPMVQFVLGRTRWASDSGALPVIDQTVQAAGAIASWRSTTASASASAFWRSRWTPLDVRAGAAWATASGLAITAEGVFQRHDGGRQSAWVGGRLGVPLFGDLRLLLLGRTGTLVQAPALTTDTAQALNDVGARLSWQKERIGVEVGASRISGWNPLPFPQYTAAVPIIGGSGSVTWLTASGRLVPFRWLTLESWVSTPQPAGVEGQPPTHSVSTGTIRTRFFRTFPSGALELKIQGAIENWYGGFAGRDASGTPIPLPKATFFSSSVAVRLTALTVFIEQKNLSGFASAYVPSAAYILPAYPWIFGLRWEFTN